MNEMENGIQMVRRQCINLCVSEINIIKIINDCREFVRQNTSEIMENCELCKKDKCSLVVLGGNRR